jgi:hypothetical protein
MTTTLRERAARALCLCLAVPLVAADYAAEMLCRVPLVADALQALGWASYARAMTRVAAARPAADDIYPALAPIPQARDVARYLLAAEHDVEHCARQARRWDLRAQHEAPGSAARDGAERTAWLWRCAEQWREGGALSLTARRTLRAVAAIPLDLDGAMQDAHDDEAGGMVIGGES